MLVKIWHPLMWISTSICWKVLIDHNADNIAQFEDKILERVGLLDPQIPPRYKTTYFNHVWGGGYLCWILQLSVE